MIWLPRTGTLLASMVVVLHTIISHEHHSEMSSEAHWSAHQQASSLFDNVVLTLHMDAGSGHLEAYLDIDLDGVIANCEFKSILEVKKTRVILPEGQAGTDRGNYIHPRGPPENC